MTKLRKLTALLLAGALTLLLLTACSGGAVLPARRPKPKPR